MKLTNLLSDEFMKKMKADPDVIAVLLFGSYITGKKYRDIDVCLVLNKKHSNLKMSKKRLEYAITLSDKFDVHIFQQLPLYIRKRILEKNKILYYKDEDLFYDIAINTLKEFEFYKKIYYNYLDNVKNGNR